MLHLPPSVARVPPPPLNGLTLSPANRLRWAGVIGVDYDASTIPERYISARSLATATLRQWLDLIAGSLEGINIRRVLDLGCGTGRFACGLRDRFAAEVIGADPSWRMLSQAPRTRGLHYLQAKAQAIPLSDASIDVVFISMAWHHMNDKHAAATEIRRVLGRGGSLCIRTSSLETLESCLYLRFFPEARRINEATLPSRASLQRWATQHGFVLRRQVSVAQEVDSCPADYITRIEKRGLSDLASIEDVQFSSGLAALRHYCDNADQSQTIAETVDFFAFWR
jgi:ubiquinone/menaquinone biosynthesis C-methylase UbiE